MAAPCFISWNGAQTDLTAPLAGVATSATSGTVYTMQQVKTGNAKIRIIEWGYMFTATPTAPVKMELVETGTVGATVTAGSTPSNYNDVSGVATQTASPGTSSTGYNSAGTEGTITATRLLGMTLDTAYWFKQQFPLGREPEINGGGYFVRIRATPTTAAATTVISYLIWEE